LFTMDGAQRSTVRLENPATLEFLDQPQGNSAKGRLTMFLECPLARVLRQSPAASVKVEPLGVKDWAYENGSYKIVRTYRITTEDGVYEITLLVSSQEASAEGEKRKWKVEPVSLMQPLQPISRTPAGQKKQHLRMKAYEFLYDKKWGFFNNLTRRRGMELWLATQPPSEREALLAQAKGIRQRTPLVAVAGV